MKTQKEGGQDERGERGSYHQNQDNTGERSDGLETRLHYREKKKERGERARW